MIRSISLKLMHNLSNSEGTNDFTPPLEPDEFHVVDVRSGNGDILDDFRLIDQQPRNKKKGR